MLGTPQLNIAETFIGPYANSRALTPLTTPGVHLRGDAYTRVPSNIPAGLFLRTGIDGKDIRAAR